MHREPSDRRRPRWWVVVPVQRSTVGKSRLAAPAGVDHALLARAIARDTLSAVCGALPPAQVLVVTADEAAAGMAHALGARVVADPGTGLNAAVRAGLQVAVAQSQEPSGAPHIPARPGSELPVSVQPDSAPQAFAVLLGDLPALTPEAMLAALDACAAHPSAVVPDAAGTGTVLLTALDHPPTPAFGPGSAQRHTVVGSAVRLDLDLPGLQQDVDDAADLARALGLGVGPATVEILRLGPPGPRTGDGAGTDAGPRATSF